MKIWQWIWFPCLQRLWFQFNFCCWTWCHWGAKFETVLSQVGWFWLFVRSDLCYGAWRPFLWFEGARSHWSRWRVVRLRKEAHQWWRKITYWWSNRPDWGTRWYEVFGRLNRRSRCPSAAFWPADWESIWQVKFCVITSSYDNCNLIKTVFKFQTFIFVHFHSKFISFLLNYFNPLLVNPKQKHKICMKHM